MTIVLTGEFESISRDKLKELIISKGGSVPQNVSGKTNILVAGYKLEDGRSVDQGSKYVAARQKGITIYTESEFEEFIQKKSGNPEFTLSNRKRIMQEESIKSETRPITSNQQNKDFTNQMWTDLY